MFDQESMPAAVSGDFSALKIGILAVQGGVAEHQHMLESLGVTTVLVRRKEHLSGLDGLVLPGGESTTISKLLQLGGLFEPLQELLRQGLPAYGTCAGMIMLAEKVENTRSDTPPLGVLPIAVERNAFGRQVDSFEAALDFAGIDGKIPAVFIRAPRVSAVFGDTKVLSVVPGNPEQGLPERIVAVQCGNLLATSFHPEVSGDHRVHKYFLQLVQAQRARAAKNV